MTRTEFFAEVLNSPLNNGSFEADYAEFQMFQDAAAKTLREFHRICEKNSIPYQLAFGSLLGAIRDNGQIPWDYDIDVLVPYSSLERLIEALQRDLSSDFYFICPEINSKCIRYMMRLAPKEYDAEALHVDVFYTIGAPDDPKEQEQMLAKIKDTYRARREKMRSLFVNPHLNLHFFLYLLKNKLRHIGYSVKQMDRDYQEFCHRVAFDKAKYCIVVGGDEKKVSEREKMWDTQLIETEMGTFRITKDYENVLTQTYGDYHRIFPLENRYREMMRSLKELRYYANRKAR